MKIIRKQSNNNSDPGIFSDLAFLLIIFFIVLATFATRYTLQLDFPASKYSEKKATIIEISLPGNDFAIYKKETIPLNHLNDLFTRENFSPESVVRLQVAANCPYQQAVTFLDNAGNAGITSVNIELLDNNK